MNMGLLNLENMKYSELQKLAKSHGIKANQKSEKLIESLSKIIDTLSDGKDGNCGLDVLGEKSVSGDQQEDPKSRFEGQSNLTKISRDAKEETSFVQRRASEELDPKSEFETVSNFSVENFLIKEKDAVGEVEVHKCLETMEGLPESSGNEMEPIKMRLRSSFEESKAVVCGTTVGDSRPSNIPRYGKLTKMQKDVEYWSRIHQRNQDKMESIEQHQKKKQSRAAVLLSGRKAREGRANVGKRRSPRLTAVVQPFSKVFFIPEVLTTDRMDLNFSKRFVATCNPPEVAFVGKKSPKYLKCTPAPSRIVDSAMKKKTIFSPISTNASILSPSSKPKFDLASSLEKPLTWVPYTGKVRPLADEGPSFRVELKGVRTRSKQDRMAEVQLGWKSKRASEMLKKRMMK